MAALEVSQVESDPDPTPFVCPVCRCIVNRPSTIPCNHIFCRSCLLKSLEEDDRCPLCRTEATEADIRMAPLDFRRNLKKLRVRCPYDVAGCPVVTELEDMKAHEKNCEFRVQRCRFKECKRPLVSENDDEAPSTKRRCCDMECLMNAEIESALRRIYKHDCWRMLEKETQPGKIKKMEDKSLEAEVVINRFMRSINKEIVSALNQRMKEYFKVDDDEVKKRRIQSLFNRFYRQISSHVSEMVPHVEADIQINPIVDINDITYKGSWFFDV